MLVTLRSEQTFPPGTSVGAYTATSQLSENLGRTPRGTPSDTQTVGSDGSLIFPDLADGEWFAVAQVASQWRYLRFSVFEAQETTDQTVIDLEDAVAALAAQVAGISSGIDQATAQALIDQTIASNNFARDPIIAAKADQSDIDTVELEIANHATLMMGRSPVHGFPDTLTDAQTTAWDEATQMLIPADLGTPVTPPATPFDVFDLFDRPSTAASAPISNIDAVTGLPQTGDIEVVAAQPGLTIKVSNVAIIAGGAAILTWKSGANVLPGPYQLWGNNGYTDDTRVVVPIMETGVGEPLILNTTILKKTPLGINYNSLGPGAFPASFVGGHLSYYT